jgi:hypothetical protein
MLTVHMRRPLALALPLVMTFCAVAHAVLRLPESLVTQAGKPFAARETKGSPVVLFFGFTNCPDVCPTTLLDMSSDLAALGDKADALDDLCDSRPRARHTRRAAGISRLVRSEDHGADRPARIDSTTTRKAG